MEQSIKCSCALNGHAPFMQTDNQRFKEESFPESPEFKKIKFVKSLFVVFELK